MPIDDEGVASIANQEFQGFTKSDRKPLFGMSRGAAMGLTISERKAVVREPISPTLLPRLC